MLFQYQANMMQYQQNSMQEPTKMLRIIKVLAYTFISEKKDIQNRHEKRSTNSADMLLRNSKFPQIKSFKFPQL